MLIDYRFADTTVRNPDGSLQAEVQGGTVVQGPGATPLGNLPKAVGLGERGRLAVDVGALEPDLRRFCVRVVFRATAPVTERQNLVESSRAPFAVFLTPAARDGSTFDVVASVRPDAHGWRAASTEFATTLKVGQWHTADVVYDLDTVALSIDGDVVAVRAFPDGRMSALSGSELFVGTWVDGQRNHFPGAIAALQWMAGIPAELEAPVDERRSSPQWFLTHKHESIRGQLDLGEPTAAISYDAEADAYLQELERGALVYADAAGAAFEMHGAIHGRYRQLANPSELGYLVTDEVASTRPGGRKSVFSRGGIYWSPGSGAWEVTDRIWLGYEDLGEAGAIGFPVGPARSVPGGSEQQFQAARMYHKRGDPTAHEVHGAILTRYLATGGVAKWGFPVTNETVLRDGARDIGRFSEFEQCTFYWSRRTGAFETHGDIRREYEDLGGPTSELGFPTSDEVAIPGVSGAGRANSFERGSILWYGSRSSIVVARPFKLFLDRVDSRESEGFGMGQNDLYFKLHLRDGSRVVFDRRHPSSGDFGGHNTVDLDLTIPVTIEPDDIGKTVTLVVDVWEADPGNDDHIGKWTKTLNAANGWGLRERNGLLESGRFAKINNITGSVKPQVDVSRLTELQKFWSVDNRGTDDVSFAQYAAAFRDVDSESEWWDVTDWLEKAFYELVVKDIAESGNCFGMALEAIYARKGASRYSLPLDRFRTWADVEPDFNVRHTYQVGASAIWWFVGQFLTGNTHDPRDVFRRTRDAHRRGDDPVVCIAENYDFSGSPHCILPVGWDDSSKPWVMDICDPSRPGAIRKLTVDPDTNEFAYVGKYKGGEWSGGRFHYMPFGVVDGRPRTPIWDAILLLLAGTVVILGTDVETASITDGDGNDLDAYGERGLRELQARRSLEGYYVGFKGFDRGRTKGTVAGELLMSLEPRTRPGVRPTPAVTATAATHATIGTLARARSLGGLARVLDARPDLASRSPHHVHADPGVVAALPDDAREILRRVVERPSGRVRHELRGLRRGDLRYGVKRGLQELRLDSDMAEAEVTRLELADLGTSKGVMHVTADRDKQLRLEVSNKVRAGGDRIKVTVEGLPAVRGEQVQATLRPGLGDLELVAPRAQARPTVTLESSHGGRPVRRRFEVALDGGARLRLAPALVENRLGVARIDRLFGSPAGTEMVDGAP